LQRPVIAVVATDCAYEACVSHHLRQSTLT
jgi:hypothetical protein